MARATQTLDYEGTFVYSVGGTAERASMRIIHHYDRELGHERERLLALTGSPREVLRDRELVTCILPDQKAVVVTRNRAGGRFPGALRDFDSPAIGRLYTPSTAEGDRVAGRPTVLVRLAPLDGFRYGYHLWLDRETKLLLRSRLVSDTDGVLEEIEYVRLQTPVEISDQMLAPENDARGFARIEPTGVNPSPPPAPLDVGWLPEGFLSVDGEPAMQATVHRPVEHRVFADGLASVSVFIEPIEGKPALEGSQRIGAVTAFGREVGGYQVTVVGEVPTVTTRRIAESIAVR